MEWLLKYRNWIVGIVFFGVCGTLWLTSNRKTKEVRTSASSITLEPSNIKPTVDKAQPETDTESTVGVLFGKRELTLKAKSQGEIYEVVKQEGDWVKEGEIIAIIDDRQEKIERDLANAEFSMASQDFKKTTHLGKYVSKDELQQKRNAFLRKKSSFELKQVDLANTRVVSPISGFVTKTYFDKGETISVGDKYAEIVQLDELIMMANIPSKYLSRFRTGSEIQFKIEEISDRQFTAQLFYVSPVIDAASDTVRLKLAIKNPRGEDSQFLLKPGMLGKLIY